MLQCRGGARVAYLARLLWCLCRHFCLNFLVCQQLFTALSRAARKHRANWLLLLLLQHAESIINEFNNNVFKCCAPALKRFLIKINKFCIVSWDMILRPLWKARLAPAFIPRGDIFSLSLHKTQTPYTYIYAGTRSVVQKPIGNCG